MLQTYYQFQITVPDEKITLCYNFIKGNINYVGHLTKIHTSFAFLLIFRIPQSVISETLEKLDALGLGVEFGIVDVLPLMFTMPALLIDKVREEKKRKTGIESLFRRKNALTSIFEDTVPINKGLAGMWDEYMGESKMDEIFKPSVQPIVEKDTGTTKFENRNNKKKEHENIRERKLNAETFSKREDQSTKMENMDKESKIQEKLEENMETQKEITDKQQQQQQQQPKLDNNNTINSKLDANLNSQEQRQIDSNNVRDENIIQETETNINNRNNDSSFSSLNSQSISNPTPPSKTTDSENSNLNINNSKESKFDMITTNKLITNTLELRDINGRIRGKMRTDINAEGRNQGVNGTEFRLYAYPKSENATEEDQNIRVTKEKVKSSAQHQSQIILKAQDDGDMSISITNSKGHSLIRHYLSPSGEVQSDYTSPSGKTIAKLCVSEDHSAHFTLGEQQKSWHDKTDKNTQELQSVTLASMPNFSGMNISDPNGNIRAAFAWCELERVMKKYHSKDLILLQMYGQKSTRHVSVDKAESIGKEIESSPIPEATLSVIDDVANLTCIGKERKIAVFPELKEGEASLLVDLLNQRTHLNILRDRDIVHLPQNVSSTLLSHYGFNV